MALLVNLRHLEQKPLHLKGQLSLEELDIDPMDELIHLSQALSYDLQVERFEKALLIQGRLHLVLDCECSRCLKPYAHSLLLEHWTLHLPLQGEDQVPVVSDCVDLTPFIREDILLAFPQQPLCETECKGLPSMKVHGRDSERASNLSSSAWAELNKLKL